MDTKSATLKELKHNDLYEYRASIIDLLNDNYRINFPNKNIDCQMVADSFHEMEKFSIDGSAILVGVIVNNAIEGFIWAYKRCFLGESRIHIGHIVVNSVYRGHGFGSMMINHIEQLANQSDILVIELLTSSENESTVQFYKKHGYCVTRVQFEKNLGDGK